MSRLPIFHDDHSFREQTERMFREMEEKMGLSHNPAFQDFMTGGARWPPTFDDSSFFQLQPSAALTHPDMGRLHQSEVLDDATARALFVDVEPQSGGDGRGGRRFRMSFDARRYDPADVAVRCEDGCLVVEARHEELDSTGAKVKREFHRRIQLPRDVDPAKLSSTLSTDGILTVEAPVPPRYQAIVGPASAADASGRTPPAVESRSSPLTVRLEPSLSRSRSPLGHDAGGRHSPFAGGGALDGGGGRRSPFMSAVVAGRQLSGNNGGYIPVAVRSSPVPFGTLTPPVSALPVPGQSAPPPGIDVPVITTDPASGRRRLELVLELARPYTADDVVVRVDGRRLTVDARHETRDQHGRVTTSTSQKQLDVDEPLDESSIRASLRDDGRMIISGHIKQ